MTFRGKYLKIDDFSGGDCSGLTPASLSLGQAALMDNVFVLPDGAGIRSRGATAYANSTEFGSANSYPVIGVGIHETAEDVLAIRNGKAYGAAGIAGTRSLMTFTDRTGAVTISTAGSAATERSDYRWTFCNHNDLLIGFGGPDGAYDAPFKWAGEANNIAALGGSPPSARFCFAGNNRVFAGGTASEPATLYWSTLGNPEDWTGTGSGSVVVGNLDDGERLEAGCLLGSNLALLFKRNSIYRVDLTAAPFAPQLLFAGAGAQGVNAVTVADGIAYFVTPNRKLMATDGNKIIPIPSNTRYLSLMTTPDPVVFRLRSRSTTTFATPDFDAIFVCNGSQAAAWDLLNKCWLYFSNGYKFVCGAMASSEYFYGGWSDQGRIFYPEFLPIDTVLGLSADDTGVSSGAFSCYWQSGWLNLAMMDEIASVTRFGTTTQTLSDVAYSSTLAYGYDFGALSKSTTISVDGATALLSSVSKRAFLSGRGKYFAFRYTFTPTTAGTQILVNNFELGGRIPLRAAA